MSCPTTGRPLFITPSQIVFSGLFQSQFNHDENNPRVNPVTGKLHQADERRFRMVIGNAVSSIINRFNSELTKMGHSVGFRLLNQNHNIMLYPFPDAVATCFGLNSDSLKENNKIPLVVVIRHIHLWHRDSQGCFTHCLTDASEEFLTVSIYLLTQVIAGYLRGGDVPGFGDDDSLNEALQALRDITKII